MIRSLLIGDRNANVLKMTARTRNETRRAQNHQKSLRTTVRTKLRGNLIRKMRSLRRLISMFPTVFKKDIFWYAQRVCTFDNAAAGNAMRKVETESEARLISSN